MSGRPLHPALTRGILRWDLLALMINGTIGAGIFGLPSKLYALIGPYSVIAFAVCALVVAAIMLCFAEVGSRFEGTGGPYLYARDAFGPAVGFQVGWLLWLARVTSFAALCNLFISYLHALWPAADSALWRPVLISAVVVTLTAINLAGVRRAAVTSNGFTVGKLAPLLLLIAVGLFFVAPSRLALGSLPAAGSFTKGVMLLIYAYTGFEAVMIPSGEIRDPRRNLPWSMLIAIIVVAVIYELVQVVCVGVLPGLAGSERPLADVGARVLGSSGAAIISVGALVSILGVLNGITLVAPRLLFAMGEQGQLPRFLTATHPRFHTPWVAILISSAIMLVLALTGSFIGALTISTIVRLLSYIAICAALPALRRKPDAPPAAFHAPLGAALAVFTIVLCLWLLTQSTWHEARDVGIALGLGVVIYFAARGGRRAAPYLRNT
jgi:APA family basic amino acid/polyamine antiporter